MPHNVLIEAEFLLRIILAAVFSAALGWERERAGKAAGFRTHIVVGVTAALFVITGILAVEQYGTTAGVNVDPTRTIHAIAVGIGFLGAGLVVFSPRDERVKGLTTAASVWGTAAVGTATGYGLYLVASGTTVILLVVLNKLVSLDVSIDAIEDRRHTGEFKTPLGSDDDD
ncbi:MAG: MgtC/SapB family protein [Gemmatimonadaceae bacterium]|nr:MgtC/SapB family protein [Gemmatimonadaceae bacterium]